MPWERLITPYDSGRPVTLAEDVASAMQRAKHNPNFFVSLSATSSGKFLPQTGAVVITDASGQIFGAAGASGGMGDEDEAIYIAGVEAAGLAHG